MNQRVIMHIAASAAACMARMARAGVSCSVRAAVRTTAVLVIVWTVDASDASSSLRTLPWRIWLMLAFSAFAIGAAWRGHLRKRAAESSPAMADRLNVPLAIAFALLLLSDLTLRSRGTGERSSSSAVQSFSQGKKDENACGTNMTYLCPGCWQRMPQGAKNCPFCQCDIAAADARCYSERLTGSLRHPEPETRIRAAEIFGEPTHAPAIGPLPARAREELQQNCKHIPFLAALLRPARRCGVPEGEWKPLVERAHFPLLCEMVEPDRVVVYS